MFFTYKGLGQASKIRHVIQVTSLGPVGHVTCYGLYPK